MVDERLDRGLGSRADLNGVLENVPDGKMDNIEISIFVNLKYKFTCLNSKQFNCSDTGTCAKA